MKLEQVHRYARALSVALRDIVMSHGGSAEPRDA